MRDDLVRQSPGVEDEDIARERFLLDEGLELLALYRSIGDPDVRLMFRHLLASIASRETIKQ